MRRILILIVLAAVVAGVWFYIRNRDSGAPEYQTAPVVRGDLTQAVTATGALNAVVNVQVGSQISGNIQKLLVDFNSPVKAGEVIAQLDPATYEAIVHEDEGELASAEAALALAQINARRQEDLAKKEINPQSDLDAARATLRQAEATVRIKQAQLEKAKVDLNRCTITAPIDGVVISRDVDVGQTVAASLQAPIIFTIANDLRKMQIDANVAEADVGSVEVGQAVDFTVDAFPYRTFHGEVAQVRNAPITVQNVVTYDTVISVNNDDLKLKPGMTANVSIGIAQRQDVVKLPNAALRFRPPEGTATTSGAGSPRPEKRPGGSGKKERGAPAQRTVYVLANGQPQPVPVKLGISDGIHTEVLEGLKENDAVITGVITQVSVAAQPNTNPLGGGRRFP
jgi:HlyD family secretion protein